MAYPERKIGVVIMARGSNGVEIVADSAQRAINRLPRSRVDVKIRASTQGAAMPLNIRSEEVNRLAKKLAARKRINKTEAVKLALESELRRIREAMPLKERLRPLQRRVLAHPATGLEADKGFYDELNQRS